MNAARAATARWRASTVLRFLPISLRASSWARSGRVFRRVARPCRTFSARRRRHPLLRRSQRDSPIPAGQALARAAGGPFERVGEDKTRTANVRLIAATNRNLTREVEAGRFRQDLYYRLNIFPVEVPPLRKHKEDIPALTVHFLHLSCARLQRPRRETH